MPGAETGSGKTLAYLLPIFEMLKREEIKIGADKGTTLMMRPRVLIFCPNKELVHQVGEVAKEISHHCKMKVGIVGVGAGLARERELLLKGVDILIGTFARFETLITKKALFTSQVQVMVFDEADALLDAGQEEPMTYFMRLTNHEETVAQRGFRARSIFVSATVGSALKAFLSAAFGKDNSARFERLIDSGAHLNLSNIRHDFIHLTEYDKHSQFKEIIARVHKEIEKKKQGCIIFCHTVKSAQSTEHVLQGLGYQTTSLHGDVPARLRLQNYERFKRGDVHFLVATDLGGRGLDFQNVSHVINFDFPKTASDYLHRVGRTGRAGNQGTAISLYRNADLPLVNKLKHSYETGTPLMVASSAFRSFKHHAPLPDPKEQGGEEKAVARVRGWKQPPQSSLIKTYRKIKDEIKKVPKQRRHQEQTKIRGINKRMKKARKMVLREKAWKEKKGIIKNRGNK